MECSLGGDLNASLIIRQRFSGFDARVLLELLSDLIDHLKGSFAHRFDTEC